MNLFHIIFQTIVFVLDVITNFYFIISIILIIILYHLAMIYFRDRKYIYAVKIHKDPSSITLSDLKDYPVVNIIVPAWKEGELFRDCLNSIKNLVYPKLKVIVNAGGNDETLMIADDFKKLDSFIILTQKQGAERASLGKIRAINECFKYIDGGIVYLMDADSIISAENFLRMIHPIINENRDVVIAGNRPLKRQERKGLTKYLLINRTYQFQLKFSRNNPLAIAGGTNTTLKFDVIKKLNKFTENNKFSTDKSIGKDILYHGFKIYSLVDHRARMHTEYPNNIKEYFKQRISWTENNIIYWTQKDKLKIFKFLLLFCFSIYILVYPSFLFLNFGLVLIGIFLHLNFLFRKIRRYLFFKIITDKSYYHKLKSKIFGIKFLFYMHIELIINFTIPFHLIYYLKKLKRRNS